MVWDNLFKGLATRVQKLQNRAGTVALRTAYDVSSKNVLEELGWSDLRTFARNFSNIDFLLKISPLKDDELTMSEM